MINKIFERSEYNAVVPSQQYVSSNCWSQNEKESKILPFYKKYIGPNLKGRLLNIGEILKTYRGIKNINSATPEEYNYTYEPKEVKNRWEKQKQGRVSRRHDIIHQIRTPIDTKFTLIGNGKDIFRKSLKKDEPFMLNLPVSYMQYSEVVFQFDPPTDYEMTYIDLCKDMSGYGDHPDPLANYMQQDLVVPDNGFCVIGGDLKNLRIYIKDASS